MPHPTLQVDGKKVRKKMIDAGIPHLSTLTAQAGITDLTLRHMMRGEPFRSQSLDRVAKALDVHPSTLLVLPNGTE